MKRDKWQLPVIAATAMVLSTLLFTAAFILIKQRKEAHRTMNDDISVNVTFQPIDGGGESDCSSGTEQEPRETEQEPREAGQVPRETEQESEELAIIRQPASKSVPWGSTLTVNVKATGEGLQYQWYFRKKTQAVFSEWVGRTHASETVKPNDTWDGIQLYCTVSDRSGSSIRSDTVTVTIDRRTRVLAVGDSICRGYRNGEKGFVGDLDVCFLNLGVSGSTLSTARKDVTNIPTQLSEADNFIPDIIIADGGYNDYMEEAPLGEIPAAPAGSLDGLANDTVMGGLQRLFVIMKRKYPDAHKFFLITHKVCRQGVYLVTTENIQGYTQQELHDAIVACCRVYGVGVIDVYGDSPLDTYYDDYRSAENYTWTSDPGWVNARNNLTDYVDADGIHPLTRGYLECYVPLVRNALSGLM